VPPNRSIRPATQLATETREVYAPSPIDWVWQLKWELEISHSVISIPATTSASPRSQVRRSTRRYMEELKTLLRGELRRARRRDIEGGRNIYSIWRKMQAKQLAFEQLMDIRAARIL